MKIFKTYPPLTYVILGTLLIAFVFIIISRIHFYMGVAKLIDGIESYQSIEKCRSFFTSQGYSWEVTYKGKDRDGEQPLDYRVSIKNYRSLDIFRNIDSRILQRAANAHNLLIPRISTII